MRSAARALNRARAFCQGYGLRLPILLAPMAGACPTELSIAVMHAGGMGACGALLMPPEEILAWAAAVRAGASGPFQMNLWIPGPPPIRDAAREAAVRAFLGRWGPEVEPDAGESRPPDFAAQCAALLEARPAAISSVMGLYPPAFIRELKRHDIPWLATATTVAEARAAAAAGADAILAQGMEAGGHRGAFDAFRAEAEMVGLFALLPAVADAVSLPVIAAGGIADARGIAAALVLGASAVAIGTGFLRCSEAQLCGAWADAIGRTPPEGTRITRAFSGRPGRAIATAYVAAAGAPDAPLPADYPVQRGLTRAMRQAAKAAKDLSRMQAWAGQAGALAQARPAAELAAALWAQAQELLC